METWPEGGTRSDKKSKDLSSCESEERGCGEGGGGYDTLMESDVVVYYESIKRELNRRLIYESVWWKTKI